MGTTGNVKKQNESGRLFIGKQLKPLRESLGLKHIHLANAIGVTPSTISNIETDKSEPTAYNMAALADYLGVTMDALRGANQRTHIGSSAVLPQKQLERLLSEAGQLASSGDRMMQAEVDRLLKLLASRAVADANASQSAAPQPRRKKS